MNTIVRIVFLSLLALLPACPPPVPIRAERCATDDRIRDNCGLCASARVCAWCGSADPAERGCYARTPGSPIPCEHGVVTNTLEGCELLPDEEAGLR